MILSRFFFFWWISHLTCYLPRNYYQGNENNKEKQCSKLEENNLMQMFRVKMKHTFLLHTQTTDRYVKEKWKRRFVCLVYLFVWMSVYWPQLINRRRYVHNWRDHSQIGEQYLQSLFTIVNFSCWFS